MSQNSIRQIKQLLRDEGLAVNKRLGQNFLIDQSVINKMVAAADIQADDTVLEIGPGLGVLTEAIANRAGRVLAVEKDRRLISHLRARFRQQKNIEIVEQDIFKLDFIKNGLRDHSYKVVANLPFYITSHFMRFILESEQKPSELVLIVQKEVAQRVVAEPGSHSLLSLSVQFYGQPKIISIIDRRSFYPAPEIEAAILKISLLEKPRVTTSDPDEFFQTLRVGFSSRRKQLHNNLSAGWKISNREAQKILTAAGINHTRRAETLSLKEWEKLYCYVVIHKRSTIS
ncbi:ribosomal RNA small subunit methyltransferase A [Patescibacteria group bacterium]|nr:ribosomal RNA small subunit methyltransferase A [Patescibacteria group bacterium]